MATAAVMELAPVAVRAQSLDDFLTRTLSDNPTIGAARAAVRATRADIAIARADGLPSLDLTGTGQSLQGADRYLNGQLPAPVHAQFSGNLGFELPLYRGGGVRNAIAGARARNRAAEADYDRIVGDTLTSAAQAFAATARDEVIVELHRENVRILDDERVEALAEAGHGVASRTDVAQSEARLAGARASLARARAQLVGSTEELARISGLYPTAPLALNTLRPPDAADAVGDGDADLAPAVVADEDRAVAARYDVGVARAAQRPQLSLTASVDYVRFGGIDPVLRQLGSLDQFAGLRATTGLSLRIPLFQGGATTARVRRARAVQQQAAAQQIETARRSLEQVRGGRARLVADRNRIDLLMASVAANIAAVRGVRIDRRLGFRSTLDVLNAEQELFASRRDLAQARYDAFSDAVALLNHVGRARTILAPTAPRPDTPLDPIMHAAGERRLTPIASARMSPLPVTARKGAHFGTPTLIACSFDLARLPSSRVAPTVSLPGRRLDYDPSVLRMASPPPRQLHYDLSAIARV